MKKSLIALCITTLSFTASATDKLSYNYFQFGLIHSAGELTSDKIGYNFDISQSLTESLYYKVRYNTQSADVWVDGLVQEVDASEFNLNLGYHAAMTRSSDFYGELGLLKQDAQGVLNGTSYGNDEEGFLAKLGVRTRWTANWESNIFAGYQDVDLATYIDQTRYEDDDTIFGVEARYYLSKSWSLGLTLGEEATGLTSQLTIRGDF